MRRFSVLLIILSFFGVCYPTLAIASQDRDIYAVIDIDKIGHQQLLNIKETPGLKWWVELDDKLVVLTRGKATIEKLSQVSHVKVLQFPVIQENLYFIKGWHKDDLKDIKGKVLATGGRFAVVQGYDKEWAFFANKIIENQEKPNITVFPFVPNTVLAHQIANDPARLKYTTDPSIKGIVDNVDGYRWYAALEKLASYNRYTKGQGILQARDWLVQQYQALPGFNVSTVGFSVGTSTGYNVVAVLPGNKRPDEWYIVGGHYDSTSENTQSSAPGAEDNASGAAGVLEMARVFAYNPPEVTVIFISYSGEEQGLYGSKKHVNDLIAAGDQNKVKAVISMDMIGFTEDTEFDCLLETGEVGKPLFDPLTNAATQYTSLKIVTSLYPFGSDHVPYINKNIPAVLVIENDWDSYSYYHKTTDLPANINVELGTQVLRMNVAALVIMAKNR